MKRIAVYQLTPGMKLAKDVILPDGRLLLLTGFIIKPLYIRKLESFSVKEVFVEDEPYTPIEDFEEEKVYLHAASTIKNIFALAKKENSIEVTTVRDTVSEIIQKVIENETVMLQITGIRDIDNYTFLHSVDVCIYSTIIGKKIGFGKDLLLSLGMGAILHDIGKCKVPIEILQKPDKLSESEFEQMKLHTVYGSEIIKNSYGLSFSTANIALQHHEKWNGSGYPLGITSNSIDLTARIVSLVDVYDALTSDRVYKKKELPHIAAEYIKNNSNILFDPLIVDLFVNSIAVYGEGTIVLLNTGELGSIIPTRETGCTRQKVNVFSNKFGPPVLQPYIIDLNEDRDIEIIEIFV